MQAPEQATAVTPEGVRAGAPEALAALVERRGAGVLAYAREVCEPAAAQLAGAEALARFRAAVVASGDAADLDPERLLLSATRHASAAHARPPVEAGGARRMLGRGPTDTCAQMPALIVARAENLLGNADLDRLGRHVDRCASCRATEAAFRRAERAYVATAHAPLDAATTGLFVAALTDAAPVEVAEAAEPEPAPEPELPPEPPAMPVVEHVEPVEAEPEPEDHTDDEGWTGEEEAIEDDTYDRMIEPGPATWSATEEPPRRRRRLRIVLPAVIVAAGAAAGLAVAGVFDAGGSSTSTSTPPPTVTSTP